MSGVEVTGKKSGLKWETSRKKKRKWKGNSEA
jgi:hypothetical protein